MLLNAHSLIFNISILERGKKGLRIENINLSLFIYVYFIIRDTFSIIIYILFLSFYFLHNQTREEKSYLSFHFFSIPYNLKIMSHFTLLPFSSFLSSHSHSFTFFSKLNILNMYFKQTNGYPLVQSNLSLTLEKHFWYGKTN